MRPLRVDARQRLLPVLRRSGPSSVAGLAAALGVSPATVRRLLDEEAPSVLGAGATRTRRWAARRALRGDLSPLPLMAVDEHGTARPAGELSPLAGDGSHWLPGGEVWPLPPGSDTGWWEGLPYPLADLRPQGWMGRQLALAVHAEMELPADPRLWNDDQVLLVVARHGADLPGHWILGERSFAAWQRQRLADEAPLPPAALEPAYARAAQAAFGPGAPPGSSAGGEFPKFTALRDGHRLPRSATPHVIVKFAGAGGSRAERRWADLLVCEHLALQALATLPGQAVAAARLLEVEGRTMLEIERFDRVGRWGRRPVLSLWALDAGWMGSADSTWPAVLERLLALRLVDGEAVAQTRVRHWFGRLVANSDMHGGNLALWPQPLAGGRSGFALAPAYDMLPMAYAPLRGGELPEPPAELPLPRPAEIEAWAQAAPAARDFWAAVQHDDRVSPGFRRIAAGHRAGLQKLLGAGP